MKPSDPPDDLSREFDAFMRMEWLHKMPLSSSVDRFWDCFIHILARKVEFDDLDEVVTGVEAAFRVKKWLRYLMNSGDVPLATLFVERFTLRFTCCTDAEKLLVETFLLEHVLEDPAARGYFAAWELDPDLQPALQRCLQWANRWNEDLPM